MASILDLVKYYQHTIEKYPNDEHKVLKCIDKLFNLQVTVQHLQETGVGRTVNALRKEPGDVGQAARSLVYKWKLMVAAEESDQEGDHNNDATNYNGHGNEKDSDDNTNQPKDNDDHKDKRATSSKEDKKDHRHMNGSYSGNKRKYHCSDEEESEPKQLKYSSASDNYDQKRKHSAHAKSETTVSDNSQDSYNSRSGDSSTDESKSSDNERKVIKKIKTEAVDKHESSSSKYSSKSNNEYKRDDSKKSQSSSSKHQSSELKHSSKEKSHSSHKQKSSKDNENNLEKRYKSDHKSTKKEDNHKEDSKTLIKHNSAEKYKSSSHKTDSVSDKHKSHSEKHVSKLEKHASSSHSSKSEKEKRKNSSDKEISYDKNKSKSKSHCSKEKYTSSSKDKDKNKSTSSKHKSSDNYNEEQKYSSSNERKSKSDRKNKHEKSSSSSSHKSSKSSSAKLKEVVPKKKSQVNNNEASENGIDSGSGASFAEALGMVSSAKPKKKVIPIKDTSSPSSSFFSNSDMCPSALLTSPAKLPPLPTLEISALPEISPNYKPRPPPKLLPHFNDEDAMNAVISSKNQRTKVYSGNKVLGKLPTLYEMCVHILQEHIDALEYTGGVPYEILKPVIDRATPQQLAMLEHYNPYLMDDTDHLWQKFCEKHFRNKKRQELETWREMYMRCQEEQEIKLKSLTANIRIAQEAKKAPIKQTKMAYVDTIVKPPRNIARKQALHGTACATTASPAARVASLASAPNVLQKGLVRPPTATPVSVTAFNKPKKAPLMQKALQFMRGRKR